MKGQRSLLLKGSAWVSAGTTAANLLGFISLIVLTRILMPEDFGLVAIAASFAEIVAVITKLSLGSALIQRRDVEQVHYDTAWTLSVLRGVIVAGLIVVSGPFVAAFYGDPRLAGLLQFLALSPLIWGLMNPKLAVFQRKLDFRQEFIMTVTDRVVTFVFAVGVGVLYQSYWALVVGAVAGSFATLILSYVLIAYRPRFSLTKWKDLLSFSIWLTLGTWVQTLNWRSNPLLFGYFLPTGILGQYRVGRQLVGKTLSQAIKPIQAMLFPAFSRLQDDEQRLRRGYMRSQGAICLITIPIAAGIALVARDLVVLLVGEKWLPAVPVIQIYAIIRIMRSSQNVNALAMATDNTKRLFFRELFLFAVRWPPVLTGIYLAWGDPYAMLIGAMLGQIVATALNIWWNMRLITRISAVTFSDHASFVWRPLIGVGVMAGVVLLTSALLPDAADLIQRALHLAVLGLAGALAYCASLYAVWAISGRGETIEKELATIVRDLATKLLAKVRAA